MKFAFRPLPHAVFRRGAMHFRPTNRKGGSALLIVLAFVVLLTGIVALFLGRTLIERTVSDSSMNQTRADLVAQSALDMIVADLKQEIVLDSAPVTVGKVKIYEPIYPATTTIPSPMMPIRCTTASVNPNLIRTSARFANWPTQLRTLGIETRAAMVSSTDDVSANGRSVSLARWNTHYLNPRAQAGSATIDSTPDTHYFTAPDWVMVTASGPQLLSSWNNNYKTTGNANFVTGRYAYAIYDEGGLIDVNVAGYPTGTTAMQIGEKGSLALADLTQAVTSTTQAGIDQLVGWRNFATAQPSGSLAAGYTFNATAASNYNYYVAPPTNSPPTFLATNPAPAGSTHTDQTFTSRQALLRYQRATYQNPSAGYGFNQDDLQYLGTFTRALNAPVYNPRITIDPTISPASPITYPNSTNPIPQEVASASTNQPLITQRFALNHLALFANPTANAAAIYTYFGLTATTGKLHTWNYLHGGTAGSIMTLAQVAALTGTNARQPDFFELLQAAILNGSLYNYLGGADGQVATDNTIITNKSVSILIHLGANIINQYQSNNFPVTITFGSGTSAGTIAGTDDLPYLSEMMLWPYRPVLSDPYRSELDGYLLFELWNPHQQNATTVPGPTKIRLIFTPPPNDATASPPVTDSLLISTTAPSGPNAASLNSTSFPLQVTLNNSSNFREPAIPNSADLATDPTDSPLWKVITSGTDSRVALQIGAYPNDPDSRWATSQGLTPVSAYTYGAMQYIGRNAFLSLQYQDPTDSQWYTYQGEEMSANTFGTFPQTIAPTTSEAQVRDTTTAIASNYYTSFSFVANTSLHFTDPRCTILPGPVTGASTPNQSIRPLLTSAGVQASRYQVQKPNTYVYPAVAGAGPGSWTFPSGNFPGLYNENTVSNIFLTANGLNTSNTYLHDGDGVVRPGDGASGGSPYLSGQTAGRPLILHRPFRSVGELGYAYRGMNAWKSIDFYNSVSADVGLLDYFSLEDAPLVAGKINLNTRQPQALKAALSGAYRAESSNDFLTATEAGALANAIVAHTNVPATTNGPLTQLMSRADLVRGLLADPAVATAIDNIKGTTNDATPDTIKTRREAVIRALVDVGTTRTWNLLIDVVAQSGRYAPDASQLSQFTVSGEKHYWLHVAIDRYTGNVIDQQLEEATE